MPKGIAVTLVLLLSSTVPISAQTVTASVTMTTPTGRVNSCPVEVKFAGQITASNWPSTSLRQLQYKWVFGNWNDQPTEQLQFKGAPAGAGASTNAASSAGSAAGSGVFGLATAGGQAEPQSSQTQTVFGSMTPGAGNFWAQLQISYPVTQSSPKVAFAVTCPIPGSLSLTLPNLGPADGPPMGTIPGGAR